jgi:hypothetical protein
VFVLELDRQGTLSDWIESRQAESGPDFDRVDAAASRPASPLPRSPSQRDGPTDCLSAAAVHDQLRELAFAERVKMHAILMEGLDPVFRGRGLKPIADLTGKP